MSEVRRARYRGQRTEVRGQMSEDGGQRTEDSERIENLVDELLSG
jgi:hypothetical protein